MHDEQDMRKMGKLFKYMPITASTFIIGWLAIAGVPPFAGFWSKDEILLFAGAESWVLYAIGIVTAVLTAFYMTRQVIMTFFGEAHWRDNADEQEAHGEFKPHESPSFMLVPLGVLGVLALIGGIVQLPSFGVIPDGLEHRLLDWLHPIVEFGSDAEERGIGEAVITESTAYDMRVVLIFVAIACALGGIVAAWAVYQRRAVEPVEPEVLEKGWYYDSSIAWFMGHPGREGFQALADGDQKVIDGAVNGVATAVRATASGARKGQTGYVRQYAGVIGIGVVLLLGWFVLIRGIL
jgi:NADH-quinone oxidoreductase subunit L